VQGGLVQAGERRSARIESLRAVAALGVLAFHTLILARGERVSGVVGQLAFGGAYGVFLFFALSGYLLFLPFVRAARPEGRPVDLRRYARNRVLRILPLYYAVLVVLLLAREHGGSFDQWWRFGTFTQSFFASSVNTVDGPMWSLAVEVQFYVLLPVLGYVVSLARGGARFAGACVASLGLASVAVWWITTYRHGAAAIRWRYSLPATFFEFTPGMLLALVRVEMDARGATRGPPPDLLLAAGLATWVIAAYHVDAGPLIVSGASLLILAAIVLPARGGLLVRVFDWRALGLIGIVSYGLYLWQFPIVDWVARRTNWSFPSLLPLGLGVCILAAAATYVLVERPFLSLRTRWGATEASHVAARAGAR
jgi:peptidoglycan/LPS O-acetylase OafA/YrhL